MPVVRTDRPLENSTLNLPLLIHPGLRERRCGVLAPSPRIMNNTWLNNLPCLPCGKSELNLSSLQPIQVSIVDDYIISTEPMNSLLGSGPLEFEIITSEEDYLDLSRCFLKLKVKIGNSNGTNLNSWVPNTDGAPHKSNIEKKTQFDVVPANLFLHSLLCQVNFSINDTYRYRSYITTMLSYGTESKKTFLEMLEFFYWTTILKTTPTPMRPSKKKKTFGKQSNYQTFGEASHWPAMSEQTDPKLCDL